MFCSSSCSHSKPKARHSNSEGLQESQGNTVPKTVVRRLLASAAKASGVAARRRKGSCCVLFGPLFSLSLSLFFFFFSFLFPFLAGNRAVGLRRFFFSSFFCLERRGRQLGLAPTRFCFSPRQLSRHPRHSSVEEGSLYALPIRCSIFCLSEALHRCKDAQACSQQQEAGCMPQKLFRVCFSCSGIALDHDLTKRPS